MQILIDLTPLADNFSGIERFAACITKELLNFHENDYCLLFKNNVHPLFEDSIRQTNVTIKILKGRGKLLFNQLKLPAVVAKTKADCYLFLAFPSPVLLYKKNVITAIHDTCCWDCPETMKGLSKWYFRISFRAAVLKRQTVITVSEFSKQRIIKKLKCPESEIWKICNGIGEIFTPLSENVGGVLEKYSLPNRYILSLSTLEPRKNIRLLINAYRRILIGGDVQIPPLVLAGRKGWNVDTLLNGVEPEVKKKILFTGFIDDADLPAIYGAADFFVFPSMYEGFGIPPLEAMACGTPVLSSNAASLPEVLEDAAYYFESKNEQALTDMLLKMNNISADDRLRQITKGIRQAGKFSWADEARKLEKYMNQST